LWIILTVLFLAVGAPSAHADSVTDYTINFTQTSGPNPAPTGTFVYDATTQTVSANVVWNGIDFAYSDATLIFGIQAPIPAGCTSAAPGQEVFLLFTGCAGGLTWQAYTVDTPVFGEFSWAVLGTGYNETLQGSTAPAVFSLFPGDTGTFSLSPAVATPEPSSVALMLIGLGLVFVMRKRIGQGLPRAS
jgi:hypothetical protein